MSQNNDGSDVVFKGMFLFFIASILVTVVTGMWLHWWGVIGAFVVVGNMADSASKRTRGGSKRR